MWAAEEPLYDYLNAVFAKSYRHFTQIVWKNAAQVGCAQTACPAGSQADVQFGPSNFFVCEHLPVGNTDSAGGFAANVLGS